jgi:lipocalin
VGVTATYTLRDRGKIEVVNRGFRDSFLGEPKEIRGTAVIPDPKDPGKLKVYFFPFIGADYWILDLDQQDYQYALVGSSSPNCLWILSRTPEMDPRTYERLVEKAVQRGLPVEKLIKVPQER